MIKIGDTCNFSIGENHIRKVEIMATYVEVETIPLRMLYACRCVNNGSVVLAWEENLQLENKKS